MKNIKLKKSRRKRNKRYRYNIILTYISLILLLFNVNRTQMINYKPGLSVAALDNSNRLIFNCSMREREVFYYLMVDVLV